MVPIREGSLGVLEADPMRPELEDGLYLTRAWSAQRAGAAPSLDAIVRVPLARTVEEEATRRLAPKGVFVNINLYGALLFHLLGAEPAEVPCLIAASRVAGIVALVEESLETVRLHRPLTRYAGPPPRPVPPRGRP